MESALDPLIGQEIQGYRIERELGKGGMGKVYLARQLDLDRPIAFKVLLTQFAHDNEFLLRFRREARQLATLRDHSRVVDIYGSGKLPDGGLFIVMEYVDGPTLQEVVKAASPLPIQRAVTLGIQIAEGLREAHRAGIVHRDIKPANIKVWDTAEGEGIKILDFGIAQSIDPDTWMQITSTNVIIGSPKYMAPETIQRGEYSERSDLYSWGVVLYEMLIGHPPFTALTADAVKYKHVHESPKSLRELRQEVPTAVESLVLQTLAKEPSHRPTSMQVVITSLRAVDFTEKREPTAPTIILKPAQASLQQSPVVERQKLSSQPVDQEAETKPVVAVVSPPSLPVAEELPRRAVRQYEREHCQWLDSVGLGRLVSLATHYQQLPLQREVQRERLPRKFSEGSRGGESREREQGSQDNFHAIDVGRWEETLRGELVTYEPVSLEQLFGGEHEAETANKREMVPRFVILGPPGSGKSTLLQLLCWRAAVDDLQVRGQSLVPVRVHLREWEAWEAQPGTAGGGLPLYLQEYYKNLPHPPTAEDWRQWLLRGEVLLLFDGLDEVESKPMFLHALKNVMLLFKNCPTVMSCRTVSFAQHQSLCPDFLTIMLGGLQEEQQEAYIRSLVTDRLEGEDPARLLKRMRSLPQLSVLRSNPLLLSVLCYVTDLTEDPTIPTTPVQLYKRALEKLLTRLPRRVEVRYPGEELRVDEKLAVLQRVAFNLFARDDHRLTFTSDEFGQELKHALSQEGYGENPAQWANALRVDLINNSDIVRGSAEQGFFFLHVTIQEFLAAGAIAKMVNDKGWGALISLAGNSLDVKSLVDRKSWDPRWHEVIILLAGQLQSPVPMLQLLADRKKDDVFGSRLALAAQCLPEVQPALAHIQSTLIDSITTAVCSLWFRHRRNITNAAIPHITQAFPALGQLNGQMGKTRLLQWLCQQLNDTDREIRAGAVEVLGHVGELVAEHPDVLSAYVIALQDEDTLVCSEAIAAVTRVGKVAARHAALVQMLSQIAKSDPQRLLRTAAAKALEAIGAVPALPVGLPPQRAVFNDKDGDAPTRHISGVSASEDFVPDHSAQPLTTLVTTLYTADAGGRAQAVDVLGQMGARAVEHPEALSALVQVALHDVDNGVRSEAMRALAQIGEVAAQRPQVLGALALAVQHDRDAGVRAQAVRTLENMASVVAHRTDLLPSLMTALRDEDTYVRYRAAVALACIMAQGVRIFRRWWGKIEAKRVEDLS